MRSAVLTIALSCGGACKPAHPPWASASVSYPDSRDARVINVSADGSGPAHQHLTLALDKAAIVQLDLDARDVLVSNPGSGGRGRAHVAARLSVWV